MEGANHCDGKFIAEIHNSAKVWVSYTEYIISESNSGGKILDFRY